MNEKKMNDPNVATTNNIDTMKNRNVRLAVATMDTATQHSKLSYQNYLEYTKCVLRGNMLK